MRMVQDRDKADTARRWGLVLASARPWQTVEEKTLKHLVPHVPHQYDQCTRVPRAQGRKGRRTFWTYHTRLWLRHSGEVTLVLSKKGVCPTFYTWRFYRVVRLTRPAPSEAKSNRPSACSPPSWDGKPVLC